MTDAWVFTMRGDDDRRLGAGNIFEQAAPQVIAMAALSIAGLLWSLQMSITDIKAQQARILDLVKDGQVRLTSLENRVRELELKTAVR